MLYSLYYSTYWPDNKYPTLAYHHIPLAEVQCLHDRLLAHFKRTDGYIFCIPELELVYA